MARYDRDYRLPRYELPSERRGRKARKGAKIVALTTVGAMALGGLGIGVEKLVEYANTPNADISAIHPKNDLEARAMPSLETFAHFRNDKNLEGQDAAVLLQASRLSSEAAASDDFDYFYGEGISSMESADLALLRAATNKPKEMIKDVYKDASGRDSDNAAMLTNIAATFDQPVEEVKNEWDRVSDDRNFQDDNKALVPTMVMAKYTPGGQAHADQLIWFARQSGLTDTTDIATFVKANLLTDADQDVVYNKLNDLNDAGFSSLVNQEFVYASLGGTPLDDIKRVYGFVETIPDIDEETAAKVAAAVMGSMHYDNSPDGHGRPHGVGVAVFRGPTVGIFEGDSYFWQSYGTSTKVGTTGGGRGGVSVGGGAISGGS